MNSVGTQTRAIQKEKQAPTLRLGRQFHCKNRFTISKYSSVDFAMLLPQYNLPVEVRC